MQIRIQTFIETTYNHIINPKQIRLQSSQYSLQTFIHKFGGTFCGYSLFYTVRYSLFFCELTGIQLALLLMAILRSL